MAKGKKDKISLDLGSITAKVNAYNQTLKNTIEYRKVWHDHLKQMIVDTLTHINEETGLGANITVKDNIENMEAVLLDMGRVHSGMSELVESSDVKKTIVKTNGGLVYQQLFNGKLMIMIIYPYIEGYGEPRQPKNIEILRPAELKQPFILRHIETLLQEVTEWEDFDDDEPAKSVVGFNNPIGFNMQQDMNEVRNLDEET